MPIQLNEVEIRILGVLLEKEKTTPEYYPLTLNALANACNQKSSRDPVMELDQNTVIRALYSLKDKGLLLEKHEEGNRVAKYLHRFENVLKADDQERAALCVLMLRGPQTTGEIKTRTDRLTNFESPAEVETILQGLAARPDGPFVKRLEKQPGQKECRYRHLLSIPSTEKPAVTAPPLPPPSTSADRLATLEKRIFDLEFEVKDLKKKLKISS